MQLSVTQRPFTNDYLGTRISLLVRGESGDPTDGCNHQSGPQIPFLDPRLKKVSIDLNFCSLVYGNLTLSPLPTKKILALCELYLNYTLNYLGYYLEKWWKSKTNMRSYINIGIFFFA